MDRTGVEPREGARHLDLRSSDRYRRDAEEVPEEDIIVNTDNTEYNSYGGWGTQPTAVTYNYIDNTFPAWGWGGFGLWNRWGWGNIQAGPPFWPWAH